MNKRELIPLTIDLVNMINVRHGDEYAPFFFRALLNEKENNDYIAYATINNDEKVLALGAVYRILPGVGEAFMTFSKDEMVSPYSPNTRWLYKAIEYKLHESFIKLNLHRIQAYVKFDSEKDSRFIERLGFHLEGLLQQFWDNNDYYIYGKVI